jgi:hypothetical protein
MLSGKKKYRKDEIPRRIRTNPPINFDAMGSLVAIITWN